MTNLCGTGRAVWLAPARLALALGLVIGCLGSMPHAWAIYLKLAPIRPAAPRFVPVHEPALTALRPSGETLLARRAAQHSAPPATYSLHDVFGLEPEHTSQHPSTSVVRFHAYHDSPLMAELRALRATEQVHLVERLPQLRTWYPQAADIAAKRPAWVGDKAEQVRQQYVQTVSATVATDPAQLAGRPADTLNAAQQLATRLILAAMEDVPSPTAHSNKSSFEFVQQLVAALMRTDQLGSRPIGGLVWGDLLAAEYPSDFYMPRVELTRDNEPGVVDYSVKSWLLPSTLTAIDVVAYGRDMVAKQQTLKLLHEPSPKWPWEGSFTK